MVFLRAYFRSPPSNTNDKNITVVHPFSVSRGSGQWFLVGDGTTAKCHHLDCAKWRYTQQENGPQALKQHLGIQPELNAKMILMMVLRLDRLAGQIH